MRLTTIEETVGQLRAITYIYPTDKRRKTIIEINITYIMFKSFGAAVAIFAAAAQAAETEFGFGGFNQGGFNQGGFS